MLTDKELQTLRNLGNEGEVAADEIEALRAALAKVLMHTAHTKVEPHRLHMELLASIDRIARATLTPNS
jgi:hypothetical protein